MSTDLRCQLGQLNWHQVCVSLLWLELITILVVVEEIPPLLCKALWVPRKVLYTCTCKKILLINKPYVHECDHFRKSVRPPWVKYNISGPFPIKFKQSQYLDWHDKDGPFGLKHANQNMPHHRKYNLKNGRTIKNPHQNMSGTVKRIHIHI